MALDKNQILGFSDIKTKEIRVPIWDDTVWIRQLTRGQQDEYQKRRFTKFNVLQNGPSVRDLKPDMSLNMFGHDSWIFAQGVVDENGKRLFTDAEVEKLNEKNGEAIGFVAAEIIKFSGMQEDIEEIEKIKN